MPLAFWYDDAPPNASAGPVSGRPHDGRQLRRGRWEARVLEAVAPPHGDGDWFPVASVDPPPPVARRGVATPLALDAGRVRSLTLPIAGRPRNTDKRSRRHGNRTGT
jgi:hypothetical protein